MLKLFSRILDIIKKNDEFFIKLLSVFLVLASLFLIFDNYLNDKIDDKIASNIERSSKSIRPFLIFDENETRVYDHGAYSNYINEIKVEFKMRNDSLKVIETIIVYPKQYLQIAPLLEPLGADRYDITSINRHKFAWVYTLNALQIYTPGKSETKTPNKFRLEILK